MKTIKTCSNCNRQVEHTISFPGVDFYGEPCEEQVCLRCADLLDPQQYAPSIMNPEGGPIPV